MNRFLAPLQIAALAVAALVGARVWHYAPPIGLPFVGNIFDGGPHWRIQERDRRIAALDLAINDPVTGYAVRLATCQGNVTTLTESLERQNEAVERLGTEAEAQRTQAATALSEAREDTEGALALADRLRSRIIQGETSCARFEDADNAFVNELEGQT